MVANRSAAKQPARCRRASWRTASECIQFRICAHPVVTDQQAGVDGGEDGNQVFDQRDNGVACGSDAKQYFTTWIIELESGSQRLGSVVVDSAQRAHQADRRMLAAMRRHPPPQPGHGDRNTRGLNGTKESAEDRGSENRNRHRGEW
jgi:hypothetical protein